MPSIAERGQGDGEGKETGRFLGALQAAMEALKNAGTEMPEEAESGSTERRSAFMWLLVIRKALEL